MKRQPAIAAEKSPEAAGVLLGLSMALVLVGCSDRPCPPTEPGCPQPAVASVAIEPSGVELLPGDTVRLSAAARDATGASVAGVQVTWSSSNPGIATVGATGLVTAVGLGVATITARAGDGSGQAMVVVVGSFLAENAVVVDSTQLTLLSDSDEIAAGILRFETVGDTDPAIETDDILVGAQGPGFLRRVASVSRSGNTIVVETTAAGLDEVIERGGFQLEMTLGPASGSATPIQPSGTYTSALGPTAAGPQAIIWGEPELLYAAPGATFASDGISLDDLNLCSGLLVGSCPPGFELLVTSGSVGFTPELTIDTEFDCRVIVLCDVEVSALVSGTLGMDVEVLLSAVSAFTAAGERPLAAFSVPFVVMVGLVPVVGRVQLGLIAGFSAEGDFAAELETGVQAQHTTTMGGRYSLSDGWEAVFDTVLAFDGKPTTWTGTATTDGRLYVRPEIALSFYEVATADFHAEPYLTGNGVLDAPEWRLRVFGGLGAGVGVQLSSILCLRICETPEFRRAWLVDERLLVDLTGTTVGPPVSRWTQVEGTLTGRELYDVWGDGSTVIAVGGTWDPDANGIVLRSMDGGQSWSEVPIPTTNPLQGVWGVGSTIIAVGWGGTVLRSTDRGATWIRASTGVTAALTDVWGAGSTFVAVGRDGTILRSTNGGVTWAAVESHTQSELLGVGGVGSVLIAVGWGGTILRSVDQGASWSGVSSPNTLPLRAVAATSEAIFAAGRLEEVLRSVDGGLSWEVVSTGAGGWLRGLWGSGSTVLAVGGRVDRESDLSYSVLLRSTDSGNNWSTVPVHPGSTGPHDDWLNGVSGSGGAVFAVGTWGAIHRSADAGGSWHPVTRGSTDLHVGVTGDGATVVAVGLGGTVRPSTDGGANWSTVATTWNLCGVGHAGSTFIAIGYPGTGLRSTDGGASWIPFTAEVDGVGDIWDAICGVWGSGSTFVAAVGSTILRSTDGGANWTTVLTGSVHRLAGVWGVGSTVIAVGARGTVFRSEDGGANWFAIGTGTTAWLSDVWGSGETFIAIGEDGTILRSNDNGLTWSQVPSGTSAELWGVAGSASTIVAVGEHGTVLRSTDGGVSWHSLESGVDHGLVRIWMPGASGAVAVGMGGVILVGTP